MSGERGSGGPGRVARVSVSRPLFLQKLLDKLSVASGGGGDGSGA